MNAFAIFYEWKHIELQNKYDISWVPFIDRDLLVATVHTILHIIILSHSV